MTRRNIKSKSPTSVDAGGTALFDIGPVDIFHSHLFEYDTSAVGLPNRATMEADLTEWRIVINGVTQRRFTTAELFKIQSVYGVPVVDGQIDLFYSEPWRRTVGGEDILAWPMGDLGVGGSFQIEVDIAPGALAPTLKAVAEKDFGNSPMGPIVKYKKHIVPAGSIGEIQWSDFGSENAIYSMHCFSADINSVLIETDGVKRFEMTKAQADKKYRNHGLVPDPLMFHVIFDYTGRHQDALSLIDPRTGQAFKEVLATFDMAAAGNFPMILLALGPRD